MRLKTFALAVCVATAAGVAICVPTGGAARPAKQKLAYTLVDLGTFGGPQAGQGNGPYVSQSGLVVGTADTAAPDPFAPKDNGAFNGDPYVQHSYIWRQGKLTDLGALGAQPAGNSSYPNGVNTGGDASGISDNGSLDPLTGTAATRAVLWKNGRIMDLGTFGGTEGQAAGLNDRDQVVGVAANSTPDPYSPLGWGTQARAFLWQNGTLQDLGTLGGPDSFAWFVNASGEIAGVSYTNSTPTPATGQPPIDAFLWKDGHMQDLGSLGGSVPTFGGVNGIDSHGDVIGQSDLPGDQTAHPFLWNGISMVDLGTLGGDNGSANAINESGAIAGVADLADGTHHAFLWANGTMHDLRPLAGALCSNGFAINASGDVVGNETNCHGQTQSAMRWRHGKGVDLNTLIARSTLHLTEAVGINDRGEVIGYGILPNGDEHNFLLIPKR